MSFPEMAERHAFDAWADNNALVGPDARMFFMSGLEKVRASDDDLVISVLELGVYLRERDLLHFRIEEWGARLLKGASKPLLKVDCVPFEGEIPCLYSVHAMTDNAPAPVPNVIDPRVLLLVDTISLLTGSGLGLRVGLRPPNNSIPSGIRVDPRTGRRMRYKVKPYPDPLADASKVLLWIERSETGRGRGRAHGPLPMF